MKRSEELWRKSVHLCRYLVIASGRESPHPRSTFRVCRLAEVPVTGQRTAWDSCTGTQTSTVNQKRGTVSTNSPGFVRAEQGRTNNRPLLTRTLWRRNSIIYDFISWLFNETIWPSKNLLTKKVFLLIVFNYVPRICNTMKAAFCFAGMGALPTKLFEKILFATFLNFPQRFRSMLPLKPAFK